VVLEGLPTEALLELRDALKYSPDQPRDESGRFAASDAVRMAPSVPWGFEPDFASESRSFPQTGEPNGLTTRTREYPASRQRGAYTSTDIAAYDSGGRLAGTFSIAHGGDQDGYFKITVRPDAQRQGIGTRLLAEAERQGVDLERVARFNRYTPPGRALVAAYLSRPVTKYSPDQPRDDHGRFTSDGGAEMFRAGPAAGAGDLPSAGPATSVAVPPALAARVRIDLPNGDPNLVGPALAKLDTLTRAFPGVPLRSVGADNFQQFPPGFSPDAWKSLAVTDLVQGPNDDHPVGSDIRLNSLYFDKGGIFGPLVWGSGGTGWSVGNGPEAVMTHEFGHAVQDAIEQKITEGRLTADQTAAYRSFASAIEPVSGYAQTNSKEAFAEAFSAAYGMYNPDAPVVQEMKSVLYATGMTTPDAWRNALLGKAAKRTVRISSGGRARDRVLDPIVARVRAQLIALAAEHGNRNKYASDQARDDHGRFSGPGAGDDPEEYRIAHRAPGPDNGAPMHNLSTMFPADVYDTRVQRQFFGSGAPPGDPMSRADAESFRAINAAQGRPSTPVTVYRALPDEYGTIHAGDWVTPSRTYAGIHLDGPLGGNGHIISATVPASSLYWNGDSINEFGYDGPDAAAKMVTPDLPAPIISPTKEGR
jgi:GNAT superfamily N-acetyltransferase